MHPRIAVLSDLHGNVPAMRAVLEDLDSQQVDEVLVGGDLVGRGPQGSRVVATLRDRGWRGVRGNHEDYLLSFRFGKVPGDWLETDEWAASRWMAAELESDDVRYIDALPFHLRSALDPALCLFHGSPVSHCDGLGPWTSDARLGRVLTQIEGDLLVCGHTHRPMERRIGDETVVNVGAVGLPFNGDRRAQYAVFSRNADSWNVDFRRVEYDVDETLSVYERSGFRANGGVTAELLRFELVHAAPFLVPFLRWAAARGEVPDLSRIDAFLAFYDPRETIQQFFRRLQAIGGQSDDDGIP